MRRPEEKMVALSFGSQSDRELVERFAEQAAGDIERFRILCQQRFKVYPPIFASDDPRLRGIDANRLVALNPDET